MQTERELDRQTETDRELDRRQLETDTELDRQIYGDTAITRQTRR